MLSDYSCIRVSEAEEKFGDRRKAIIERNEKNNAPYSYLSIIRKIFNPVDNELEHKEAK